MDEEDEYVEEMRKKIKFMKRRLSHLENLKNEKQPDIASFINKIYRENDYSPFQNFKHPHKDIPSQNFEFSYKGCIANLNAVDVFYKKLSLICHPDKVGNDNGEFIKLQNFRKNKDLYELVCMANEYKVDVEYADVPKIHVMLEKKIYLLEQDIESIIRSEHYPFLIDDDVGIEKYAKNIIELINTNKELKKTKENLEKEMKFSKI